MKQNRFSMVELLIVMGIILLLAGIVMAGVVFAKRNARSKLIDTQVKMLQLAMTEYKSEYGIYPYQPVAAPLPRAIVASMVDRTGAPYVDLNEQAFSASTGTVNMIDAFGNPFYYQSPGTVNKKTFDLWSMGPDGKHGLGGTSPASAQKPTEATDDITNWTRR